MNNKQAEHRNRYSRYSTGGRDQGPRYRRPADGGAYRAPYNRQEGRIPAPGNREPSGKQPGKNRKKKQRKRGAGRIISGIFKWIFIMLLLVFLVGGISAGIIIHAYISGAPELTALSVAPGESASYICDADGKKVQKLTLPEANRDIVLISQIPTDLQHAFVAIEDSRFYRHNGIDVPGIIRAAFNGLRSGSFSEGASTITQQLIKNTVFTNWTKETTFRQRLKRKVQEQYLAVELEKIMTKQQILEDYLNTINLGAGCYGVQAAAYRYFGKDVSELTLSEDAVIAAIPQNPTRFNPITNPEENSKRRQTVLNYMQAQGYISDQEYKEALADNVYARIQSNEDSRDVSASIYTFYQDALIDQVIQDLQDQKGYTDKQAYKAVYAGGLRIFSAQDASLQQICDEEFKNPANFPAETMYGIDYALSIESADGEVTHYGNEDLRAWLRQNVDPSFNMMFTTEQEAQDAAAAFRAAHEKEEDTFLGERITVTPQPQASVVILDQATGYVKAIVGGRGQKEASLTLNRATYTTRQPGSTFKVLTAFAPAINQCGDTLATVYDNGDYYYENGMKVSNWDVSDYGGTATVHEAIVRSINVVAVECITKITPKVGYDYARAFGISTLTDHYESGGQVLSDVVQPLALGGITKGVSNLELCGAYACIANEGIYMRPLFYTKVTDHEGNVILDMTQPAPRSVLKSSTASLLTRAMQDVITDEKGTAHKEISLGSMPVAGKTGTTSDYRDIWFAGYTPYYTCCVWGGYDNNDCLPDNETGHNYSKVLWNSIMRRVHEALPLRQFPFSGDIIKVAICRQTGDAADLHCTDTYDEWFALGTQPTFYCKVHGSGTQVSSTATNVPDIVVVPGGPGSSGTPPTPPPAVQPGTPGAAGNQQDDSPFPITISDSWGNGSQDQQPPGDLQDLPVEDQNTWTGQNEPGGGTDMQNVPDIVILN